MYLFCLSECLFVSNQSQNCWTDRVHFFVATQIKKFLQGYVQIIIKKHYFKFKNFLKNLSLKVVFLLQSFLVITV